MQPPQSVMNWSGVSPDLARQVEVQFLDTGPLALLSQDMGPGPAANELLISSAADVTLEGGGGNDVLIAQDLAPAVIGNVLLGDDGDDRLIGKRWVDTLDGGAGDDVLIGGAGNDAFIVEPGEGRDVITDFVAGAGSDDVIDLQGFAALTSLADVLSIAVDDGSDTTLAFSPGNSLTLSSVRAADLHADDFLLSMPPSPDLAIDDISVDEGAGICEVSRFSRSDATFRASRRSVT